ncbi:porin family protein [Brevundimonas balnearis]|uniref:Porin family protein n=1 Tax=Brevundimonas balnearis TaxID=1572858 RepID=A0ABV6R5A9_9CAUL
MKNILLTAAALSLIAGAASAQSFQAPQTYGTIGYTQLDGGDGDLGAVTGRFGAKVSPWFGAEGEASIGVRDDDVDFGGVTGSVEHEWDAAVYGVAFVPVSERVELFGRLGYGTTEVSADLAGFEVTEDGESINYGAGANFFLDERNGIRADWTRRDFDGDDAEVDTYSLNYVRRF